MAYKETATKTLNRNKYITLLTAAFLFLLAIIMLIPTFYTLSQAFKPINELQRFPPTVLPESPTFDNFKMFFSIINETAMPFERYFFNTVLYTVAVAGGQIIIASLCSYGISKIPFPGANLLFYLIIFAMMFPASVTGTPRFILFSKMHLLDTYAGMIVPAMVNAAGFYLMKQFMESSVPDELLDAGRIDGASEFRIFFKIAMPLLRPAWYTLLILAIQNCWNDAAANTYRVSFKTVAQAISEVAGGTPERAAAATAASLLMMIVPNVCFIFMQSKVVETMGSAGLKG